MEKKVVAIIGCGRIASMAHLPALSALENVRIKYACDALIEKAIAGKCGILGEAAFFILCCLSCCLCCGWWQGTCRGHF